MDGNGTKNSVMNAEDSKKPNRRIFVRFLAGCLIALATVLLSGCEHYASEERMKEYAAGCAYGETVEFVKKISDRRLQFKTKERGIVFDVWTFPTEIDIERPDLIHEEGYALANNYRDALYDTYRPEIEKLMEQYGLSVKEYSYRFDCISDFFFAVDFTVTEEQIDRINGFLRGLRDLNNKVWLAFPPVSAQRIDFSCKIAFLWEDGHYYYGVDGGRNFTIEPWTTDEKLDIRRFRKATTELTNSPADVRVPVNGVLIEVKAEQ